MHARTHARTQTNTHMRARALFRAATSTPPLRSSSKASARLWLRRTHEPHCRTQPILSTRSTQPYADAVAASTLKTCSFSCAMAGMVGENFVSIKRLNVGPAPDMFKGLPGVEMLVPIANPVRANKHTNRCRGTLRCRTSLARTCDCRASPCVAHTHHAARRRGA